MNCVLHFEVNELNKTQDIMILQEIILKMCGIQDTKQNRYSLNRLPCVVARPAEQVGILFTEGGLSYVLCIGRLVKKRKNFPF